MKYNWFEKDRKRDRRYLRGYRGLKYYEQEKKCKRNPSIPARVSWIEIMDRLCGLRKQGRRYLRGYRGLKYTSYTSTKFIKLSIPARVSWIEIHECQLLALPDTVDTCEGIVD